MSTLMARCGGAPLDGENDVEDGDDDIEVRTMWPSDQVNVRRRSATMKRLQQHTPSRAAIHMHMAAIALPTQRALSSAASPNLGRCSGKSVPHRVASRMPVVGGTRNH